MCDRNTNVSCSQSDTTLKFGPIVSSHLENTKHLKVNPAEFQSGFCTLPNLNNLLN